jgi:uncharacterized protein (DUF3820 family)
MILHNQKMTDTSLMPWGKYKGKRLIDIPAGYFIWLWDDWGIQKSGELHRGLREYISNNLQALRQEVKK